MRPHESSGFSLVEMLVAIALLLAVVASVFSILDPAQGTFQAQGQVSDMQQRLRVGLDTLARDLVMAGAGLSAGAAAGPLTSHFAPVMPYRRGDVGDDPRAGTFFRRDAISLVYVPPTAAQTTLRGAVDAGTELIAQARVNCGPDIHDRLCGFTRGMRVLLFNPGGVFDTVTLTDVSGEELHLEHRTLLSSTYNSGDAVAAEVETHTYYLKSDAATSTFQLMHYDGYQTDLPVVDDVVSIEFEYFGDPQPPRLIPDPAGGPERSSYGPQPPPIGVDAPDDSWGAGENCVFAISAGVRVPRLATLGTGVSLVRLDQGTLEDGPWCPDDGHGRRFDADLLRIRRVRAVLRVQAAAASMRGPAGVLFTRGGVVTSAERFIPDQEIRLDVTPRNMGR